MIAAMRNGSFDAALMAFRVDPDPVGVADVWGGAAAASGDGFNFGRYASPLTDTLLAQAARAGDPVAQRSAYRLAYQRIIDDAPAVFLYEPSAVVAHSARLQPAGIRPDAWWAHLAHWHAYVPTP
jgi:ABC-type transport system substrate-binding protein